jgi:hypothetical protein
MRILAFILIAILVFGCAEKALPSRESAIPANATKMTPSMDIHPPAVHSPEWAEPVPLPFPVNTAGAEDSPFITPDGDTLYFFFTPDPNIPANQQLFDNVTGIYVSRKTNGTWSEPGRVVLNNDIGLDGCQFVDGDTMWFCSVRKGNMRPIDIFTAKYRNGKWGRWQSAGRLLNVDYQVGELHLHGNELYYHSERPGGMGGVDIWVTRNESGSWTTPENVYQVNTAGTDGWPFISDDGGELWFLRIYNGSPGIFRSQKVNGSWGEPELIISSFAGEPSLDRDGNIYFVHHFYNNSVMVEADIYVAKKLT